MKQQNLVLFAATPNDPRDPGIYPAALPSTISVADSNRKSGLSKYPTYKRFTDFTIDG